MILYVVIKLEQKIDFKFHKRNHDVYDTLIKTTVLLTVKKHQIPSSSNNASLHAQQCTRT